MNESKFWSSLSNNAFKLDEAIALNKSEVFPEGRLLGVEPPIRGLGALIKSDSLLVFDDKTSEEEVAPSSNPAFLCPLAGLSPLAGLGGLSALD